MPTGNTKFTLSLSLVCLAGLASLQGQEITYDSWASANFSDVLAPEAAPGEDPDEDGIPNLREYAFDLDPHSPDASPEEGGILEHDGNHYLFIRFPRRSDASDLRFEVRSKNDVYELCDGTKPYDWVMGSSASQPGLVSTDNSTDPPTVTIRDYETPLESNVFRGFLQLYLVLDAVEQDIAFVSVADPGNVADGGNVGALDDEFDIGEREITNDQYAEFLNAVASEDDWLLAGDDGITNAKTLFHPGMEIKAHGGIRRHGEPGFYTYSVKPLMGDKPVVYISYLAACRYCNWLHNGKPKLRCRRMLPSTTEDGAYDLTVLDGGTTVLDVANVLREPDAKYYIPNKDEWHKAAFYDPTKVGASKYWTYGTRSDQTPALAIANSTGDVDNGASGNVGNYDRSAEWDSDLDGTIESSERGNVTTVASSGPTSSSYYEVYDMTGNVAEWTEEPRGNWGRQERGGGWDALGYQIAKSAPAYYGGVSKQVRYLGFRVARRLP